MANRKKAPPVQAPTRDREVEEKLAELKREYQELHKKKIETDTNIRNLTQQLEQLRARAEKEYGTSDLEELRHLLEQRRQENERLVAEYSRHIEEIKQGLAEVERAQEEG